MKKVSVVIPFYNRSAKIGNTLLALDKAQEKDDIEIIIVNDGSKAEEREKLQSIRASLDLNVRIIDQENSGASVAINTGIKNASGDLIVLFDDDIIPPSDILTRHAEHHHKFPGSVLCGVAYADSERLNNDIERYKQYMEMIWKQKRPDLSGKTKISYDNFVITTCNTSFSKATFDKTGGFDPGYRDGYDVEFGFKALQKGITIFFDPELKTIHDDNITLSYYGKRQKEYVAARKRIAAKYPDVAEKILRNIPLKPAFWKRSVYYFLRSRIWLAIIEKSPFRYLIPKLLRYRLYGATIAAISLKE